MTQTLEEQMKTDLSAAMVDENFCGRAMRMFFLDYCKDYPKYGIEEVHLGQPPGMPRTLQGQMIFTKSNVECLYARNKYSGINLPAIMKNLHEKLEKYKFEGPNPAFEHCADNWLRNVKKEIKILD